MTTDPNASDPLDALAAAGAASKTATQTARPASAAPVRLPSMPAWKALVWPIAAYVLFILVLIGDYLPISALLNQPCLFWIVGWLLLLVGSIISLIFLMQARPLSRRGHPIRGVAVAWVGFGMSAIPLTLVAAWFALMLLGGMASSLR